MSCLLYYFIILFYYIIILSYYIILLYYYIIIFYFMSLYYIMLWYDFTYIYYVYTHTVLVCMCIYIYIWLCKYMGSSEHRIPTKSPNLFKHVPVTVNWPRIRRVYHVFRHNHSLLQLEVRHVGLLCLANVFWFGIFALPLHRPPGRLAFFGHAWGRSGRCLVRFFKMVGSKKKTMCRG